MQEEFVLKLANFLEDKQKISFIDLTEKVIDILEIYKKKTIINILEQYLNKDISYKNAYHELEMRKLIKKSNKKHIYEIVENYKDSEKIYKKLKERGILEDREIQLMNTKKNIKGCEINLSRYKDYSKQEKNRVIVFEIFKNLFTRDGLENLSESGETEIKYLINQKELQNFISDEKNIEDIVKDILINKYTASPDEILKLQTSGSVQRKKIENIEKDIFIHPYNGQAIRIPENPEIFAYVKNENGKLKAEKYFYYCLYEDIKRTIKINTEISAGELEKQIKLHQKYLKIDSYFTEDNCILKAAEDLIGFTEKMGKIDKNKRFTSDVLFQISADIETDAENNPYITTYRYNDSANFNISSYILKVLKESKENRYLNIEDITTKVCYELDKKEIINLKTTSSFKRKIISSLNEIKDFVPEISFKHSNTAGITCKYNKKQESNNSRKKPEKALSKDIPDKNQVYSDYAEEIKEKIEKDKKVNKELLGIIVKKFMYLKKTDMTAENLTNLYCKYINLNFGQKTKLVSKVKQAVEEVTGLNTEKYKYYIFYLEHKNILNKNEKIKKEFTSVSGEKLIVTTSFNSFPEIKRIDLK